MLRILSLIVVFFSSLLYAWKCEFIIRKSGDNKENIDRRFDEISHLYERARREDNVKRLKAPELIRTLQSLYFRIERMYFEFSQRRDPRTSHLFLWLRQADRVIAEDANYRTILRLNLEASLFFSREFHNPDRVKILLERISNTIKQLNPRFLYIPVKASFMQNAELINQYAHLPVVFFVVHRKDLKQYPMAKMVEADEVVSAFEASLRGLRAFERSNTDLDMNIQQNLQIHSALRDSIRSQLKRRLNDSHRFEDLRQQDPGFAERILKLYDSLTAYAFLHMPQPFSWLYFKNVYQTALKANSLFAKQLSPISYEGNLLLPLYETRDTGKKIDDLKRLRLQLDDLVPDKGGLL